MLEYASINYKVYTCILHASVSWRSCKQSLVPQSTMESEYMAAAEAANEGVWLRKFAIELGVFPSMRDPVNIFYDVPSV
jgi:hypothetical protein